MVLKCRSSASCIPTSTPRTRSGRRRIREEFPNVVVSSRIVRRWIEYDRLSTSSLAAYVKPMLNRFVGALEA